MQSPASTSRVGPLNPINLSQLLDKSWEGIFSNIIQEKLKKLPNNPIIIIVPTAPVVPKIINKWIKLISHLATVITVPSNFGKYLIILSLIFSVLLNIYIHIDCNIL